MVAISRCPWCNKIEKKTSFCVLSLTHRHYGKSAVLFSHFIAQRAASFYSEYSTYALIYSPVEVLGLIAGNYVTQLVNERKPLVSQPRLCDYYRVHLCIGVQQLTADSCIPELCFICQTYLIMGEKPGGLNFQKRWFKNSKIKF